MTLGLAGGATTKQPRLFLSEHSGRQHQATSNRKGFLRASASLRFLKLPNFEFSNFELLINLITTFLPPV
jgi:hypothetical protein